MHKDFNQKLKPLFEKSQNSDEETNPALGFLPKIKLPRNWHSILTKVNQISILRIRI